MAQEKMGFQCAGGSQSFLQKNEKEDEHFINELMSSLSSNRRARIQHHFRGLPRHVASSAQRHHHAHAEQQRTPNDHSGMRA